MKEFEDEQNAIKATKDADPKQKIKSEFRRGTLTAFAAQDLIRLYEVMDTANSAQQLENMNRKRLAHFSETLDLKRRGDKMLKKSDFETYERSKKELFPW